MGIFGNFFQKQVSNNNDMDFDPEYHVAHRLNLVGNELIQAQPKEKQAQEARWQAAANEKRLSIWQDRQNQQGAFQGSYAFVADHPKRETVWDFGSPPSKRGIILNLSDEPKQPDAPSKVSEWFQTNTEPTRSTLRKPNALRGKVEIFSDPRTGEPDIASQLDIGPVAKDRQEQVQLNLDRAKAAGQISDRQYDQMAGDVKTRFGINWLTHEAKDNNDGTTTYRGIKVPSDVAPTLAQADSEHVWNTGVHLGPSDNWKKAIEQQTEKAQQTGSGLLKGVSNSLMVGTGPKPASGEEGAYAVGDALGSFGIGLGATAATGPIGGAGVMAGYAAAREANREIDAGKPLSAGAIATSGALGALSGVSPTLPLGVAGKIASGAGTGYVGDIGSRVVDQWGNDGKLDLSKIDYTPGVGTALGAGAGAASPLSQQIENYLMGRKTSTGSTPTIDEQWLLNKVQKESGWSDQDMAFYTAKGNIPPHGSIYSRNQPVWTSKKNPSTSSLENALEHGKDHYKEFSDIYPSDPTYYVQATHDLRSNLPEGTELKITPRGQRLYYHEPSNTFMVQNEQGIMQSMYRPKIGRPWFDQQEGKNYGKNR